MTRIVLALAAGVGTIAAFASSASLGAHLTAVSPYTFHRDIVPIVEAKCGSCHGDGTVSGLSLFRYADARGASWRMRQVLIRDHMPPWFAEGAFKAPPTLTTRELNVLMTWAAGGAPEGKAIDRHASVLPEWPMGTPDTIAAMPQAFTFQGDRVDQVHDVRLPSLKLSGRLIRAVDVKAGSPAMVRRAEIIARGPKGEQILGLWQPGESTASLEGSGAFRVQANASIWLRMHYRKQFGGPVTDQSQLAIYFAPRDAVTVETIEFSATTATPQIRAIARPMRAVALRPISGPSGARVLITSIDANGTRRELARLRIQRDWDRRYAFDTPFTVAAGNKIEVSIISSDSHLWNSLSNEPVDAEAPVRLAVEFVP